MAAKASPRLAAGAAAAGAAVAAGKLAHNRLAGGGRSRAYRLKDGEPLPEGIVRIAEGRIDHALDELQEKTDSSPEEAVHKARKDMKKLRGLLRLVRAELGDDVYRRENECFRDVARSLSGARDADVMVETLEALAERYPDEVPAGTRGGLRSALTQSDPGEDRSEALAEAAKALEEARVRISGWPLEQDGFEAIEPGLRRVYRRGRKAHRAARENPTSANLHDWRKRVKDLWYHATLLECSSPDEVAPLEEQAHALSDLLGDDHDLDVLGDRARRHPAAAGGAARLEAFQHAIQRRRGELQAEAFELADIYDDKPKQFSERFRSYWRGWREATPTRARS